MGGYKIRCILFSQTETWREVELPDDITFERLHSIIQKLFGFDDYHMWEFRILRDDPDSDQIDLYDVKRIIGYEEAHEVILSEVLNENNYLVYEYDFGDSWELFIEKIEDTDYKNKTALLTDYKGKYSPRDDMGGIGVFDIMVQALNDGKNINRFLSEYGLEGSIKPMDFEKKYKIGSRIRI